MPRRYRRRNNGNRDKYSVEQTIINAPNSGQWDLFPATQELGATRQVNYSILPPTDVQGMRKIKHFQLTFTSTSDSLPFYYALVLDLCCFDNLADVSSLRKNLKCRYLNRILPV